MIDQHYDVVIAGGGMTGLSFALTLARQPACHQLKVLVVDAAPFISKPENNDIADISYNPSFDARASALSLSSIEHFRLIGCERELLAYSEPIKTIHVSDMGHVGNSLFDCKNQSLECFGVVVENHWLGSVLLKQVQNCAQIETLASTTVARIRPKAGGISVDLQTQSIAEQELTEIANIEAGLLVIADGTSSKLRKQLGIDTAIKPYGQTAIIANITTQQPHLGQAFERFTSNGAVALLPLPQIADCPNRSALVWTMPEDEAGKFIDAPDSVFIDELQKVFGYRLGAITRAGARHAYPLSLEVAKEEYRSNIVLMGNAAHTLHPIAGQGFNLSLRDIAALVRHIATACSEGESIGALPILQGYAQNQQRDKNLTINFSHYLTQLYQNSALPVQAGRNVGLLLLDVLNVPKEHFVKQAAGIAGRQNI